MARILTTISQWPDDSMESRWLVASIQELCKQQHNILLILPPNTPHHIQWHHNVRPIQPFRRQKIWELPRLMPTLLDYRPEAFHWIDPTPNDFGALKPFVGLLQICRQMFSARVVFSFHTKIPQWLQNQKPNRHLWSMADTITVLNQSQKDLIKQSKITSPIEVVSPPPLPIAENAYGAEKLWPSQSWKKFLILPGPLSSYRDIQELLYELSPLSGKNIGVIAIDGWGTKTQFQRRRFRQRISELNLSESFLVLDDLVEDEKESLMGKSLAVLLVGLDGSGHHLPLYSRLALSQAKICILSQRDAESDNFSWVHNDNSILVSPHPGTLQREIINLATDDKLQAKLLSQIRQISREEIYDNTGNRLSRIFTPTSPQC